MEANKNYINAIESIPDGEQIDTTENRVVNMILAAFNEDESDREFEIPKFDNMQQMGGKYIMLTTY